MADNNNAPSASPVNDAGRLRAALWAIANTYDDHELRQKAKEAYDASDQSGYRCADCKAPLRAGYTCDVCDSDAAEAIESEPSASPAALTDSKIEGIWMGLDRSGSSLYEQPNWEREMRRRFARALLAASPADQGEDARTIPAGWKIAPDEGGWSVVSPSGDACYLWDADARHGQITGTAIREVFRQLCSSLVYRDAAMSASKEPPKA